VDSCSADDAGVIKCAERIIYREKWRICQERAAAQLLGTTSLHWTALFPGSTVIHLVALDGVVIGLVRRHGRRWIATATSAGRRVADCDTFAAAVLALARHCDEQANPHNTTSRTG